MKGEEKKTGFPPDFQASMMQNLLATVPIVIAVNRHTYSWEVVLALYKAISWLLHF